MKFEQIFFRNNEKETSPEISPQKIRNKILQKNFCSCQIQQICRKSLPKNPTIFGEALRKSKGRQNCNNSKS